MCWFFKQSFQNSNAKRGSKKSFEISLRMFEVVLRTECSYEEIWYLLIEDLAFVFNQKVFFEKKMLSPVMYEKM